MLAFITREQLDLIRASDPSFNYDTAIPQSLHDAITEATCQNPCGHVVFVYQKGLCGGYLQACTNAGAHLVTTYMERVSKIT